MAGAGEPTTPPVEPMEPAPVAPEPMPMEEAPMAPPSKSITSGGIIAMVGGILIIVAMVLPWVDTSNLLGGQVYSGFETGIFGILTLIFAILIIILALVKKPLGAGILGILSLIFVIIPLIVVEAIFGLLAAGTGLSLFSYGWYLALIGSILAMIGGFVGHKQM